MRFGLRICVNRFLLEKSLQIAEGWAYLYSQPHVYFVRCCSCIVLIVCDLLYSSSFASMSMVLFSVLGFKERVREMGK